MTQKLYALTSKTTQNIFQRADDALEKKPQKYLRNIVTLNQRTQVLVPRNNPHQRLVDHGIIPKSKYTLDVYLQVAELFSLGKSPDQICDILHKRHQSLRQARLSREFIKKATKLISAALLPDMLRLVPDDGQWTLMIDGTSRSKDASVFIVISAAPLDKSGIIPLVATFLPSENVEDVLQLLYHLKIRLPSQPKSVISDFRLPLLQALQQAFPNAIAQGCHYHMIEMIARILLHPIINAIQKKIKSPCHKLVRWAHHSIYQKKSPNVQIVARSIIKLCTSNVGQFGQNFLQFCLTFEELTQWALRRKQLLHSDQRYLHLLTLLENKVWKEIRPLVSQLQFTLEQFKHLRRCLTTQQYKTQIISENGNGGTMLLDLLVNDWIKLGQVSNHPFNTRFTKSAEKLQYHYSLITPAIRDTSLHRTTSSLENLYSQIKHLLRRWSGTKQVLPTFQWAAGLASITQALKGSDKFMQLLNEVSSYQWVEQAILLSKHTRQYRLQINFAHAIAKKSPQGIMRMLDNLVIRDIIN